MKIIFPHNINTHTGLRASHGSHMKGCTCFIHEETDTKETLHILRWTSTVCLQGARCIIINTDLQHMRVYNIHMHVSIGVCDIKMCDVLRV